MKYLSLSLIALTIFSCQQPAKKVERKKSIDPKYLITCEGIGEVKLSDTPESLRQKFGSKALTEHENSTAGFYTTVWEKEPQQINIYWNEKRPPFKSIKYLEAIDLTAPYLTKDSVKLGLSLKELVKINGNIAVTFKNTNQATDPGLIKTFNGGNIDKSTPCIKPVLERAQISTVHKDEYAAFLEKQNVDSFDPLLNRISFEVASIRLYSKQ